MLTYPRIDPVALSIGTLDIYWYGLMYLLAFGLAWMFGYYRASKPHSGWTTEEVGDLVFYGAVGGIAGGRFGYMLFYGFDQLAVDPFTIFRVWEGGMSFHGGVIGLLLALWLFARSKRKPFWQVADFGAPLVPLGIAAGRIGNFINGELWGRVADVPWAMVFPNSDGLLRHPSQLYEGALEGLLLFVILWCFSAKPRPTSAISGLFFIGYAVLRSSAEYFREPDAHLGFIAFNSLTMGQLLSIPMLFIGIYLVWHAYRDEK